MNSFEYIEKLNKNGLFEDEFLSNLRVTSREEGIPVMLHDTAKLLSIIVSIKKPKAILEIGTAVGYSGSIMLKYSDEKSSLTTIELDEKSIEKARKNFEHQRLSERCRIFQGDAEEIIPQMSGHFDFILLDGPKSRYLEFYPYLKKMLNKDGVLFCDNVLFRDYISGEEKNPHRMQTIVNNMRNFLDVLSCDQDLITQIFDVGDGISISTKIKD